MKHTRRQGQGPIRFALCYIQCLTEWDWLQVEKLPGGSIEDCRVLKGVMFQKDVVAPGRMRRKISAPRVLLLDCPLEYKKGENQTNVELTKEEDWCARCPAWHIVLCHIVFRCTRALHVLVPTVNDANSHIACHRNGNIEHVDTNKKVGWDAMVLLTCSSQSR